MIGRRVGALIFMIAISACQRAITHTADRPLASWPEPNEGLSRAISINLSPLNVTVMSLSQAAAIMSSAASPKMPPHQF